MPASNESLNTTDARPGTPLNRKYRPQSFDATELIGQDHIVRTLQNAIRNDRVAQAYLFCGPRGTGKTSTARILAKAVNCLDPDPGNRPCNTCMNCVAINSGATSDVIEIDAASNRGIDDIRDLRERVNYAPSQLKRKFYIIDEAHQITGAAANAFLKTLEEPPAHAIFVLATTDPEELPATILSRCQRFDFRRHTVENIAQRIGVLAKREEINLTPEAIGLVAELAHGSMRDPVGLLDQLANVRSVDGSPEISLEDVRALVGISGSEAALSILTAIVEQNAAAALESIQASLQAGQDPRQLNHQIVALIRDAMYLSSGASVVTADETLRSLVGTKSLPEFLAIASAFTTTDSDMRTATLPQMPLEMAVVQAVLGLSKSVAIAPHEPAQTSSPRPEPMTVRRESAPRDLTPISRPGTDAHTSPVGLPLEDRVRNRPEPKPAAPPTPAVSYEPPMETSGAVRDQAATIDAVREAWLQIRADVKSLDRRTEALLMEIDPFSLADGQIVLASPYDFHRNMLNDPERKAILETVIERRIGVRLRVSTALRSELVEAAAAIAVAEIDSAAPITVSERREATEEADQKYLNAVVSTFDGEVLEN